ncbi:MAG: hypothetical protein ACRDGA_02465 [Bacteroidota bacterium]
MDLLTEMLDIIVQTIIENAGPVIAFVVGTILAIISTYYAVKAFFLSKQEAEKAPRIEIRLYRQNADDTVYFVLPFKPHRKFLIPLCLTIKNEGSLSAKDVEVFMEMNDSLYARDSQRRVSNIAAARNVTFAAEEGRNKNMTTSYRKVGNLPPGQTVQIVDEIGIDRTTVVEVPVEVTTKDDVKVKLTIRTIVALIINVKVTHENAPPINKELRVQFRKGSTKRTNQFLTEEGKLIQQFFKEGEDVSIPRCFIFFEEYESVGVSVGESPYRIYRANHNSVKVMQAIYK